MNKIINAREFKTKYKTKYSAMVILKNFLFRRISVVSNLRSGPI